MHMDLTVILLLSAAIILACVIFNKISSRLGIPMLLAFILLGMFFGSDGIAKIPFDNYGFAQQICSVALIFIMFYGGFGTNMREAKPVLVRAVLLSSLGTILTAALVGVFCHYVLGIRLLESFLIGAVISSTDAASVFSILRSKHLGLKYNTASLLEIESGSNDPFSYMLTVVVLALLNGSMSAGDAGYMMFAQVIYGVLFGVGIAILTLMFLKRFKFASSGFDAVFFVAVAIVSYALPTYFGGNGYLGAYITGIILGNSRLDYKSSLVHFFDGATSLMQMLLFFLLGLLSFPSQFPQIALTALIVALFLTFVARPVAVFMVLAPFKSKMRQMALVSWAGLRGAASIVFAIMIVIDPATTDNDIFHMVFFIVLFSILIQGTLIPFVAKKLHMTDKNADVMKTFTDYTDEVPVQFIQFEVEAGHPWTGKAIKELTLPPESLFVLLMRDGKKIVPNGSTVLHEKDIAVLSGRKIDYSHGVLLYEKIIHKGDEWADKTVAEIPSGDNLIIMIRRKKSIIIPAGSTTLKENDILVINEAN